MWLERISGGGADLIELADAKAHLRLLEDDFDAEVSIAIAAASAFLDVDEDGHGEFGFPLVSQDWSSKSCGFTRSVLRLPFSRVTSLDEIRYIDPTGVTSAVPPASYMLVKRGRDWHAELISGYSWPSLIDRPDAVDVRFTAGFGDVAAVPEDIKAACRLMVEHFFNNRSATEPGDVPKEISLGVGRIVRRYRKFAM